MKNGNWIKWVVCSLAPMVLGLGIWVGSINAQVEATATATEKVTEKVEKVDEKVDDNGKKLTQILCVLKPEECL